MLLLDYGRSKRLFSPLSISFPAHRSVQCGSSASLQAQQPVLVCSLWGLNIEITEARVLSAGSLLLGVCMSSKRITDGPTLVFLIYLKVMNAPSAREAARIRASRKWLLPNCTSWEPLCTNFAMSAVPTSSRANRKGC